MFSHSTYDWTCYVVKNVICKLLVRFDIHNGWPPGLSVRASMIYITLGCVLWKIFRLRTSMCCVQLNPQLVALFAFHWNSEKDRQMEIEIDALGILIMTISCFVSDPRLFRRYSLLVSINFVCCCWIKLVSFA